MSGKIFHQKFTALNKEVNSLS